jgi:superfamily II DNA or RNA helicase
MIGSQTATKSKILSHLRKLAPYSVVEKGIGYASNDHVTDFSNSGTSISGVVRDDDNLQASVSLVVLSAHEIDAQCTCCSREEMREQWCPHAVALLWRAAELDFFDERSGFGERESTFRMNSSSPSEIATVLHEVLAHAADADAWQQSSTVTPVGYTPKVNILLDLQSDRLGVKVLFDDVEQEPTIFEGFRRVSSRALDNILLHTLEDEGSWDDHAKVWYINSSRGIELVLGLIEEYPNLSSLHNLQPVKIGHATVGARLSLEWKQASLDLSMKWELPSNDGVELLDRTQEIFGTGPFWSLINSTIYRLSGTSARIASIFGHSPSITVPRSQVGPILEVLEDVTDEVVRQRFLDIEAPELQPSVELRTPAPVLHLERRDTASDHFTSNRHFEVGVLLDFEYPPPPPNSNIIYLRNRIFEDECIQTITSLGFISTAERRKFTLSGDEALDFLYGASDKLPGTWKLHGLEAIKKGVKFADVSISVSLTGASQKVSDDEESSRRGSGIDWFDCHVSVLQNNANLPLSSVFKNAKSDTDRWTRLDSGAYARVPGGSVGQLRTILGMVDPNCRVSNTIKTQLSLAQAISLSRINDEGFTVALDKRLAALSEKLSSFAAIKPLKPSKSFQGKLRKYQEDGISWLHFLKDFELGGILADEMGLGKTVQTLAFFQYLKDKRPKKESGKPVIIVAPTSVITNWGYEIKKFTPDLSMLLLHGPNRKGLFAQIPEVDIVLTSYALLRLDRYELERYEFSYIVLDEAQNVKNPLAATTKAAKSLRGRYRLALTGTPTENRPMELWSIIDFLMPGYLGSYDFFRTNIERPILEGGPAVQVAQMLTSKTRPFILRRIKADVEKELPPKIESVLHVEMTAAQRQLYSQILNEVRPKVFDAIKKKGIQGASVSILAALLRLRQVCNHPNSIDAFSDAPGYDSGKFNLLKELVQEALENGRKILLFSQFRGMLSIIRTWLDEMKSSYLYLDGATRNRQELIDQFSSDESIRLFLISLKAGGAGLNLMAADTVIIYDPWWNPAVESQAVDRAHRIGQNKTVSVYRLVTEDSVEQKIMTLKSKKAKLVDALINENGLSTLTLSKGDLESLFSPMPNE